jgi:F-type H+-transporting ATPase subunit delta
VFHGNRWAGAFVSTLGENADEGFVCLKALANPLKGVSGLLFGYSAAHRLEAMLRSAIDVKDSSEYAIRFICLLVEKNQFRNIDMILRKIEESLDKKNGILSVSVEAASSMDDAFERELRSRIIAQTGAAELKMDTLLVPALLGGYRLRMGGFYIDASLKGQIEKMKADLEADI